MKWKLKKKVKKENHKSIRNYYVEILCIQFGIWYLYQKLIFFFLLLFFFSFWRYLWKVTCYVLWAKLSVNISYDKKMECISCSCFNQLTITMENREMRKEQITYCFKKFIEHCYNVCTCTYIYREKWFHFTSIFHRNAYMFLFLCSIHTLSHITNIMFQNCRWSCKNTRTCSYRHVYQHIQYTYNKICVIFIIVKYLLALN